MKIILALVLIVGMAMCSTGIWKVAANNDWTNPAAILGYVLGALAILIAFAGFTHRKVLFISDEKQAILPLIGIIIIKLITVVCRDTYIDEYEYNF